MHFRPDDKPCLLHHNGNGAAEICPIVVEESGEGNGFPQSVSELSKMHSSQTRHWLVIWIELGSKSSQPGWCKHAREVVKPLDSPCTVTADGATIIEAVNPQRRPRLSCGRERSEEHTSELQSLMR